MEPDGLKVYRLFGDVINKYKQTFEHAENRWRRNIQRNSYFDADFHFVSTLSKEDRYHFWTEKITYFTENEVEPIPIDSSIVDSIYWIFHYTRYEQLESELLWVIKRIYKNAGSAPIHRAPIFYFRDFIRICEHRENFLSRFVDS